MKISQSINIVILVLLVLLCPNDVFADNKIKVYGVGARSCGEYLDHYGYAETGFGSAASTSWVGGYISAFNANSNLPDVAESTDISGIMAWITNYCHQHPLDTLYDATSSLITELVNRQFNQQRSRTAQ